jgi:hypothetical protein
MWKRFVAKIFLLAALINIAACSESNFDLSAESRLPKWFSVPNGVSRDQLKVTIDYYVYPSGREAVLKLYDKKGFFRLKKVKGSMHGLEPMELKNHPAGFQPHYPSYEIITVDGVTDIVEHRGREPVFYMCDDPAVWKELSVEQK